MEELNRLGLIPSALPRPCQALLHLTGKARLGADATGYRVDEGELAALREQATASERPVVLPPDSSPRSGLQFACVCMDVTARDATVAIGEGFDSMELLKRSTGIAMGPCQGRACLVASQRLCAIAAGRSLAEAAPTTARPPWAPVALGTLAGPRRTPRRETTLHDRHVAAGATFAWVGDRRVPGRYASPELEVDAVRSRVGVLDVGAVGKFRVEGPEALAFLERLYPCRVGDLEVGWIRPGLLLNEEGAILDEGVVARLDHEVFYATAGTGDPSAVERWLTRWLAAWGLDARILDVSGASGAVALAGPRSRDVLGALTTADLSAEAITSIGAAEVDVAGVPSLVLRTDELRIEIHMPAAFAEHVWDAIVEAGAAWGIAPFGFETHRILNLEEQRPLIGTDTDAGSDPFAVGLGGIVEIDKEDFVGLLALRERGTDPPERLVGFGAPDAWLPPEGASVVRDGRRVGRVTSARRSPTVGSVIGIAWVPADLASDGTHLEIRYGGSHTVGTVRTRPWVAPNDGRILP